MKESESVVTAKVRPSRRRTGAEASAFRNETRSSQALLAENTNLKALCKVLGVVPE